MNKEEVKMPTVEQAFDNLAVLMERVTASRVEFAVWEKSMQVLFEATKKKQSKGK